MDSIGDNVMAIICVVVGILIIGCALVPIVDNASTEEITNTTETSGFNSIQEGLPSGLPTWWLEPVASATVVVTGSTITVNGEGYVEDNDIFFYPAVGGGTLASIDVSNHTIALRAAFDGTARTLSAGTVSYSEGTLTITGTDSDSQPYSGTKETTLVMTAVGLDFSVEPTEVYGVTGSPIRIGEGQRLIWGSTTVTLETETLPAGMTKTVNEDGTATFTFSSGNWCGPYKWTGSITTTTTEESEYAGLYNIIPVLCILGTAFVLIRRFY